jgi:hypothetical protein
MALLQEGDSNNVVTFFYDGGAMKKAIAISYRHFIFFPFSLVLLV